jgi:hypothetical protein
MRPAIGISIMWDMRVRTLIVMRAAPAVPISGSAVQVIGPEPTKLGTGRIILCITNLKQIDRYFKYICDEGKSHLNLSLRRSLSGRDSHWISTDLTFDLSHLILMPPAPVSHRRLPTIRILAVKDPRVGSSAVVIIVLLGIVPTQDLLSSLGQ